MAMYDINLMFFHDFFILKKTMEQELQTVFMITLNNLEPCFFFINNNSRIITFKERN